MSARLECPMVSVALPLRWDVPRPRAFSAGQRAGDRSPRGAARAGDERAAALTRTQRLLLVEDNAADVDLVREALAELPFAIGLSTASDGEEALAMLHEAARRGTLPDVVLLDLNLPRMGGHEVLARLKRDPALSAMAVVVLTSSSSAKDSEAARALLADDFVTKPLDVHDYFSVIQATARRWLT